MSVQVDDLLAQPDAMLAMRRKVSVAKVDGLMLAPQLIRLSLQALVLGSEGLSHANRLGKVVDATRCWLQFRPECSRVSFEIAGTYP